MCVRVLPNASQANGPISIIFGGVIRLYPVMVLIYFPCPSTKYRFLVISIFSLKNQYKIPLVLISRQGLQHLPARSIHTSGHGVHFIECLLTKTHFIQKKPFRTNLIFIRRHGRCVISHNQHCLKKWLATQPVSIYFEKPLKKYSRWPSRCLRL